MEERARPCLARSGLIALSTMLQSSSHIFLVGPRASGKTTVGSMVAQLLHRDFIDTDQALCDIEGQSVALLVERHGWDYFRAKESLCLLRILEQAPPQGLVVSTGGGMVLATQNRALMRQEGTVFYLCAPAPLLAARLAADPAHAQRPSLTGLPLVEEVEQVLLQRDALYRQAAHHVLDAAQPPPSLARSVLARISGEQV